jgi:hypothetical protein
MYLNLLVAVLSAIAGGAISLSGILPDPAAHLAVAWCTFGVSVIGIVNGVLHGYSAPQAGPAADTKPPVAVLAALALGTALFFAPSNAEAQIASKAPSPKGTIASDIYKKIQSATLADLQYADNLAVASGDQIAHACWAAWAEQIIAEQKANAAPPPEPHLITDIQRMINLHNALSPTGKLAVSCAPLANAVKLSIFNLLGQAALGTLALPALVP